MPPWAGSSPPPLDTHGLSRAEKVARIAEIRAERPFLTNRERARLLGMTLGAYYNLVNDPEGAKQKARRERYRGTCDVCGKATDPSNGPTRASKRCLRHNRGGQHQRGTGPTQARVFALLRERGPMRFVEIRDAMGWTSGWTSGALHRYVSYGFVERVSRGLYRMAERDA